MRIEIEFYRGWAISFDTEKEVFYCTRSPHDTETAKKSYAAVKTYIDQFIKENTTFKPFWVERLPSYNGRGEKLQIIGIRKDGRLIYESDGAKGQLNEYSEKDYILYDESNTPLWEELESIAKQRDELDKKRADIEARFKSVTAKEYKKQIQTEK
jgi:hypothetical protein